MGYARIGLTGACLVAIASIVTLDAAHALAQRPRSSIERRLHPGKGFWDNQRASRNIRHARDYARDLYGYSRDATAIEPEVAKAESEQLGKNIEAATKELDRVRADAGGDKDTLAALDAIQKHLAKAAATHAALHAECCKDSVDGTVCAQHCSEITKELEMASAEHAALMRKLDLQKGNAEADSK